MSDRTPEPPVPKYYLEWAGRRVQWVTGPQKGQQGTVYEVARKLIEGKFRTLVSVARDDGFVSPWINPDDLVKLHDPDQGKASGD